MKSYRSFLPLAALVMLLTGYNFMSAAWTAPSANPPNNNTEAPINVGLTTQAKAGNFMANIVAAATSTWSPEYCDEFGNNCWDPSTGTPGDGDDGDTDVIYVGGQCFAPHWAVTCNWNWSGDGNDDSTIIVATSTTPTAACTAVGRSYRSHKMILAQCAADSYSWYTGPWTYVSTNACPSGMTGSGSRNETRVVQCRNGEGVRVADSFCQSAKPATTQTVGAGGCYRDR